MFSWVVVTGIVWRLPTILPALSRAALLCAVEVFMFWRTSGGMEVGFWDWFSLLAQLASNPRFSYLTLPSAECWDCIPVGQFLTTLCPFGVLLTFSQCLCDLVLSNLNVIHKCKLMEHFQYSSSYINKIKKWDWFKYCILFNLHYKMFSTSNQYEPDEAQGWRWEYLPPVWKAGGSSPVPQKKLILRNSVCILHLEHTSVQTRHISSVGEPRVA